MEPFSADMCDDEARQWAQRLVPAGCIPTPEHDNVVALLWDATLSSTLTLLMTRRCLNYREVAYHLLKVMIADTAADWRYASDGSVWGRVATAMGCSNTRNMRASVNHVDRKPWQSKLLQHISASHGTGRLPRPSR